jgi:transcriptional regulator with XRE-family HTH domain
MKIGGKIKKARMSKKITLEELGRSIGSGKGYIHDIEAGRRPNPGIKVVSRIAKKLSISIDNLVDGVDFDC